MPLRHIKRDIKRHRPIDWFAIAVLISISFVLISVLSNKIDEFDRDMDREAELSRAYNLNLKQLKDLRAE